MIAGSVGIKQLNQHFQWMSEHVLTSRGATCVNVVLDRAAWHTSEKLRVPSNSTLLQLPL